MAERTTKIDPHKAVTSDPYLQTDQPLTVDHGSIAARAYELWQQRGCPIGSPEADWFRAEDELRSQTTVQAAA